MTQKLKYERPVMRKLNAGITNKFGTRTEFEPVTHIDSVPVKSLLADFGSPLFVISEQTIRSKYKDLLRAFETRYPKVQPAWSYKTNYLNGVCRIFHQMGSWAEVVSGFEYKKALNNGVPGEKILFNGPDKKPDELREAIKNSSLLHIDHLDELYKIQELAGQLKKKARVTVRVNMDTGIYPMWDRFGFNYETGAAWSAINKIMLSEHLDLIGLHAHIGTFMLSPSAYGIAASKLADLAIGLRDKFSHSIEYIDLGGGFPSPNTLKGSYLQGQDIVPSFDDFAEAISSALLLAGFQKEELPILFLETGRALIDEAGFLLGTVLANKRLSDGRRATIMDFGVNLLFTSFWYNHKISPAQEFSSYTEDCVLYGPLCMNIDVLRESCTLPLLNAGDQVVVHKVGAYNMTQWMQFISMRPRVVLIDLNGKPHVIREIETLEYLESLEKIPEHLKTFKL